MKKNVVVEELVLFFNRIKNLEEKNLELNVIINEFEENLNIEYFNRSLKKKKFNKNEEKLLNELNIFNV